MDELIKISRRENRRSHYKSLEKSVIKIWKKWWETLDKSTESIPKGEELPLSENGYVRYFELRKEASSYKYFYLYNQLLKDIQNKEYSKTKDFKYKSFWRHINPNLSGHHPNPINENMMNEKYSQIYDHFDEFIHQTRRGITKHYFLKKKYFDKYFKKVVKINYDNIVKYYIYPEIISEHKKLDEYLFGRKYLYRYVKKSDDDYRPRYSRSKNKRVLNKEINEALVEEI